MKLILPLLAALAGLLCAPVQAQWHWIDKNGRPVFSDRPPPPDIPDKNIRKQPGMRAAEAEVPPPAPGTAKAEPATPRQPTEDKALAARRQQATEAETEKRRVEEERVARIQADSCARARQARSGLTAGSRVARTNEKGEREFLDEAGIAAEMQRIDAIIAADCK